ncbi:hypothetical protein CSHISOI_05470 [Colletotrichum shisoi]|uniref:Uncharacterized protein n=1 Tax=Colletotrichum shisoi TaxID=2078593 RepID=A0A5Q4BSS1_9PEZI|nr:hypothetical protein CSHISOI_05470 [Colletotrichum shisoi]
MAVNMCVHREHDSLCSVSLLRQSRRRDFAPVGERVDQCGRGLLRPKQGLLPHTGRRRISRRGSIGFAGGRISAHTSFDASGLNNSATQNIDGQA